MSYLSGWLNLRRLGFRWVGHLLIPILILILTEGCAMLGASSKPEPEAPLSEDQRALNLESFQVAWETIRDRHWDPELGGLDWQAVHEEIRPQVKAAERRSDYYAAMESMIDRFDQSHFSIAPADIFENLTQPDGSGDRDGTTGIDVRIIEGKPLVTRVEADSPAAKQGVKLGWEIVEAQDQKVAPVFERLSERFQGQAMKNYVLRAVLTDGISGPVGETRKIRFKKESGRKTTLEFELIPLKGEGAPLGILPPFPVWLESRRLDGDIGYLAFNAFMDPMRLLPAYQKAIDSFRDCQGIVIDIRGNGGGLPGIATGMAGWLIDSEGEYFGEMNVRGTKLKLVINPRAKVFAGPVAMLIDDTCASCAEMFPAGMRDIGRARLFGVQTAGAVLAGRCGGVVHDLEKIGEYLGIIFQIKDDLLDLFGKEEEIGKPVGSDIREGRKTLFTILLRQTASEKQQAKLNKLIGDQRITPSDLEYIRNLSIELGVREQMDSRIHELSEKASAKIHSLAKITDEYRKMILDLLEYDVKRTR